MVTLQDVADELSVTRATVSYVLSNRGNDVGISQSLQAAVREKARELGYRPNRLASSLRTRATRTIGVVLTTIKGDIFGEMFHGIQLTLGRDYRILVGVSEREPENEKRVLESFEQWMVEGIIIAGAEHSPNLQLLERLQQDGIPVVQIGRSYPGLRADVAEQDEDALAHTLTTHLLDLGHREIFYLRSPRVTAGTLDRAEGYARAMRERKLTPQIFPAQPVESDEKRVEFARRQTLAILQAGHPPFGIVAHDVFEALGATKAIEERGLRCPADVSICAVRSARRSPLYDFLKIRLTLAEWSIEDLGMEAAGLLLDRLQEKALKPPTGGAKSRLAEPRTVRIPCRLLLGDSTAAPADHPAGR